MSGWHRIATAAALAVGTHATINCAFGETFEERWSPVGAYANADSFNELNAKVDEASAPASEPQDGKRGHALAVARAAGFATNCLPAALQTVLADLEQRFGPVIIVSTTELHTGNHSRGSVRAKLHLGCKAVDIRTSNRRAEVLSWLRRRAEVGGVNTYRNGVVHFDLNAAYAVRANAGAAARQGDRTIRHGGRATTRRVVTRQHARAARPDLPFTGLPFTGLPFLTTPATNGAAVVARRGRS